MGIGNTGAWVGGQLRKLVSKAQAEVGNIIGRPAFKAGPWNSPPPGPQYILFKADKAIVLICGTETLTCGNLKS